MTDAFNADEVVKTTLTETEQVEAQKYEKIVDEGLAGYVNIGEALFTIRDQKLFIGPFKQYTEERFDINYPTANRFIVAARVALNLKNAGLPIPTHRDQAYQLHELTPENQVATWQKVLEQAKQDGVRVTTRLILEAMGKQKSQPVSAQKDETHPTPVTSKAESPVPPRNVMLPTPVANALEPVEETDATAKPDPLTVPNGEKHEDAVAIATLTVGKALSNLQTAFGVLEGAEITAYEELEANLSEVIALVNGIRGLLPNNAVKSLKLVG